jgi:hypothetical protein
MVKQRFLRHFKPWLFAVSKAGALIVAYQILDQARRRFQCAPLDISDVLKTSTIALFTLALVCGLWAWGEWCCFKLRSLRRLGIAIGRFADRRTVPTLISARTQPKRMV